MKLSYINENPLDALDYCERVVNNGSRSQFTEKYLPQKTGNPFTCKRFNISILKCSQNDLSIFGHLPNCFIDSFVDNQIYVHPDLIQYYPSYKIEQTELEVTPTSSSRTVKIINKPYYIKLCYPGRIGRITRELDERHIYSSLEITERFERICQNNSTSEKFAFMPEYGGILFSDSKNKIGLVIRNQKIVGKNANSVCKMIPGFSLFSVDRTCPKDKPLLSQILELADNHYDKNEYLLSQFCYPLIDVFFNCVMQEGIIPELHSQNVIFGFDENWKVKSIIIRDLESHDKDVTLMHKFGKSDNLNSFPFKCIDDSQYNYSIKHSFMFDHKLGEYLIEELIKVLSKKKNDLFMDLCREVRKYVLKNFGFFIKESNFFPTDGKWYKFKDVTIDRTQNSRPYVKFDNPLFR